MSPDLTVLEIFVPFISYTLYIMKEVSLGMINHRE